jgi:hypothetical protein
LKKKKEKKKGKEESQGCQSKDPESEQKHTEENLKIQSCSVL